MDREACCVKLSVQPTRDEKIVVLVQNAASGAQLTIRALHHCENGHSWEAFGHYRADATGTVNVKEDPSVGGTYCGVEQMGLLWSLRPIPGSKRGVRLRRKNVETPIEVLISVYQGHHTEGFSDQAPLACLLVERWYMAPSVSRIPVTEEGLTGTMFVPPDALDKECYSLEMTIFEGPGPFPGVLDLQGGGGRLAEYHAALLASNGIASLAIEYMTPEIAIKMVDNKYFETAYRFLQQHPKVHSSRIGMMGLSFGSSMTLKCAAYSGVMRLRCAVCISGSHMQPVDGSVAEFMAYLEENTEKSIITKNNERVLRNLMLPIPSDPLYKVDQMGQLKCPLLVVVGKDDQNWPAHESAEDMKEMMEQAGNSHLLTILEYPKTGHLIEPPYTPHFRATLYRTADKNEIFMTLWGGEPVSHSYAQEDAWRKILAFLRGNLYSNTNHGAILTSQL